MTVYGRSVENISFFIPYIGFTRIITVIKASCIMLQRLPHNLTVARLLHKYATPS